MHRRRAALSSGMVAFAMLATLAAPAFSQQPEPSPADPPPGDGSVPRGGAGAILVPPQPVAPAAPAVPADIAVPRLVKYAAPVYPAAAQKAGIEGTVTLKLDIDVAGRVTRAIVHIAGGQGFDEAALAAAPGLEFEPARRKDGTPVAARILYRYNFTLQPATPSTPGKPSAPGTPKAATAATTAPQPPVETLAGRVLAAGIDAPLAGISVTLRRPDGATEKVATDAAGAFHFNDLPVGKYHIDIAAEGFEPFGADEEITADEAIAVKYRLTVATTRSDGIEISVRGERSPREVTRRTLERREINRIPGTSGDALRALQNLPGVARSSFGGLLVVRGSAPQDSLTFIDRTPVPIIYHFGGLASVVPTEMLDKIDFYPGNFGAEYGRAMGGIVDVGLRSPNPDRKYHGVAQLDLIDARLVLEGPIPLLKGWSFIVAGRRSWIDAWLGPVLQGTGSNITQAPAYYDYQLLIENRPSARERFRASFYGSDDAFKLILDEPPENEPALVGDFGIHTSFQRFQLSYESRWSETDRIAWTTAIGRDSNDFQAGPLSFTNEVFALNVRLEASHRFQKYVTANLGADVSGGLAKVTVHAPAPSPSGLPQTGPFSTRAFVDRTYDGVFSRPGVYAELEIIPVPRLRLVPGLRLDFAVDTGELDVSPRLSGRYDLAAGFPKTTVKGGVGVYHQPPQFQESVPPFGTRGLSSNRAVHYSLGMEQDLTRQVEVSVDSFVKQLDRLVVSEKTGGYSNDGSGYAVGGELLLKYKPDERFFGWAAYTLSRSVRASGPGDSPQLAAFDQTHVFTILGSVQLGKGWEFGARFRLSSGNLQTPYICNPTEAACNPGRVNAVFHASENTFEAIPYGGRYSERLPLFHQLDLRIDKKWRVRSGSISGYLDIQNAYNNQNVEGLSYNFNYTARTNITGLPLIPSIGLRGDF